MQNSKTDAAEREQMANLFALCRAARRKSLQSRVNAKLGAREILLLFLCGQNNSAFCILHFEFIRIFVPKIENYGKKTRTAPIY